MHGRRRCACATLLRTYVRTRSTRLSELRTLVHPSSPPLLHFISASRICARVVIGWVSARLAAAWGGPAGAGRAHARMQAFFNSSIHQRPCVQITKKKNVLIFTVCLLLGAICCTADTTIKTVQLLLGQTFHNLEQRRVSCCIALQCSPSMTYFAHPCDPSPLQTSQRKRPASTALHCTACGGPEVPAMAH